CLFCTSRYGWGLKGFYEEANTGEGARFQKWMAAYLTYVLPLIVLSVFILGICDKFGWLR
ncbi:MAG: sodium-dependent transporter, partial [Paludibacteraceae bacterium]|nr:sodium-dependent transporter [Paludibacteraceae bacterium]